MPGKVLPITLHSHFFKICRQTALTENAKTISLPIPTFCIMYLHLLHEVVIALVIWVLQPSKKLRWDAFVLQWVGYSYCFIEYFIIIQFLLIILIIIVDGIACFLFDGELMKDDIFENKKYLLLIGHKILWSMKITWNSYS